MTSIASTSEGCLSLGIDLCGERTAIAASDGRLPPLATLLEPPGSGAPRQATDGATADAGSGWGERLRAAIERVHRRGPAPRASRCVLVVPPHASDQDRRDALAAVEASVDQGLVASQPFAIVYGLDRAKEPTVLVDVAEHATHLHRLDGDQPRATLQVTVAGGVHQVDLDLVRRISLAHSGTEMTLEAARALRERHATLSDPGRAIVAALPRAGRTHCLDVTEMVLAACGGLARPVLAALHDLLWESDPDLRAALRRSVLLVGCGVQLRGLDAVLEQGLAPLGGGRVRTLAQPQYAGCRGALKIAVDLPEAAWARVASVAI